VTSISSPCVKARPRSAGQQAPAGLPRRLAAARAARLAAALAGLVAIGSYLFIALSRLNYPFAVEWLEGNSLVEVHRILAGQPLYPAPTAGYVPDGYPPLYFAGSAVAARVLGVSYLPLRLVSLVSSLACLAVLGRLVQRETGSIAAGTGAAGVFAATYFATGTWFDTARVDSLFLAQIRQRARARLVGLCRKEIVEPPGYKVGLWPWPSVLPWEKDHLVSRLAALVPRSVEREHGPIAERLRYFAVLQKSDSEGR